ncbi:flagellar hook-associated protein FlgK [Mariniblastus fucicola]|uniref:Flagellar hook-associated protein 1 n=1 Tax=Mariniblastus fucicola TaxID=980251 RepID=A0A5B9PE14_9BACT|nr:flagellar hook-associated protein FlgK [Mariniblastus fucicola]QEG23380.1 Flagellar hook-associated protein 1 [Mariniblastus fucicola]
MTNFMTGLSALRTSQYAMEVVSSNIANADTEGYHRRSVHLEANTPNAYGQMQIGTGVSIDYIERIRNQVTESSLTLAISDVSRVDQTLEIERQVESLFQSGEGSIHELIDDFFGELTKLTSTPGEPTQRTAVVQQADQMTQMFSQIAGQLTELKTAIGYQVEQEVASLNEKMVAMSDLNARINQYQNSTDVSHELDELDALVNQIAEVVDVRRNEQYRVGSTLAFGDSVIQQGIRPTLYSTFTTEGGELAVSVGDSDKAAVFEGGRLPALLDAYNNVIPEFMGKLDELAAGMIQQFDQVHATGTGPGGSFSLLNGTRNVVDPDVPLSESGVPFPIEAGELHISITDPDGNRRTESVYIDPETQSLTDVATAISAFDDLHASINSQTNQFQVIATPGYEFDFSGSLESTPNLDNVSGTSVPAFSGRYLGDTSQTLSYEISGSGNVGVSDDLFVNVYDEQGTQLARLNIGEGYEAGSELDVVEGVKLSFASGTVVDSDSFESELVTTPDETGFLASLGLNSFFQGVDASTIAVNDEILEDSERFASGTSSDLADTSNLFVMIELQQSRGMSDGTRSFGEFVNEVTTTIGIQVQNSTQLSSSLGNLQTRYEQERDAVSGVDLNEELVYLQQFQKQYEASVRVIQTAEAMLDELFAVLR